MRRNWISIKNILLSLILLFYATTLYNFGQAGSSPAIDTGVDVSNFEIDGSKLGMALSTFKADSKPEFLLQEYDYHVIATTSEAYRCTMFHDNCTEIKFAKIPENDERIAYYIFKKITLRSKDNHSTELDLYVEKAREKYGQWDDLVILRDFANLKVGYKVYWGVKRKSRARYIDEKRIYWKYFCIEIRRIGFSSDIQINMKLVDRKTLTELEALMESERLKNERKKLKKFEF
jgi:hypothetical protein